MSDKAKLPVSLQSYFFTESNVKSLESHQPDGNRTGTKTTCNTKYTIAKPDDSAPPTVIVEVTIKSDDESSINAPYSFNITAFGMFSPENETAAHSNAAKHNATQLLIGAIRHHLASTTSCMPWGPFHHGFIIVDTEQKESRQDVSH